MGNDLIVLDRTARRELEQLLTDGNTAQKIAKRARIVLMTADGHGVVAIMREVGVSKTTVWRWQDYFAEAGVDGLIKGRSKPPGRKPLSAAMKLKVVEKTVKERPANATHGSVRSMAKQMGISHTSVQRIWAEHGLKPHLVRSFKISNDPDFVAKVEDIVGLYLNPPEKALVLSVDEKSQIQALDRTQPILPLRPGIPERQTHDYARHGTTTLFAALNVLSGEVLGDCMPRHRHQEFLRFLRRIERSTPRRLAVHLILDNYGTHTHPAVEAWFRTHPRYHRHFTPTGASWLNLVERFFAEITDKRIRRGTFCSVGELVRAIRDYIRRRNHRPRPFVWTASARSIARKVRHCNEVLETGD